MAVAEPARPQSAAAPSPFTPIADYAFLSDCHSGALVAPDGTIDWLCVPRFDAPSVFGSLLDRQAGGFRLGPYGFNVPAARRYEPGTNVLVTTWHVPGGWVEVRDALTIGPRRGPDTITPHTRPPADDDAGHVLVRTVTCLDGAVEIELLCEPVFDYGRDTAEWRSRATTATSPMRPRGELTIRLRTDMALGVEGGRVRARHTLRAGERLFCALSWAEEPRRCRPARTRPRRSSTATAAFWRTWLDRARPIDHRWREPIERAALTIKGLTYMPTGATWSPRSPPRSRDAGRRAQLGLPLRLDARRHLHAARPALAQPRLGGRRVHAVRRRPRARRRRRAADHVRDRRPPRPHRVDPRRPLRLRRRAPGADRQRRLRPAPERRLRRGARLDPAPHARAASGCRAACGRSSSRRRRAPPSVWREPDQGIWEARGAPQHYVSSKLMGWVAHGSRGEARGDRRRGAAAARVAGDGRRDPGRHPRARHQQPRRAAPALRHRRARRLDPARRALRLPPGGRPGAARDRAGDRGRADRGRLRAALPHRGDRRRPLGQGGHVRDLLVLARLGARRASARSSALAT